MNKKMSIQCNICNLQFDTNHKLRYHKEIAHIDEQLICVGCNKELKRKITYQKHISICLEYKLKEQEVDKI